MRVRMTLEISFQPPARHSRSEEGVLHQRRLDRVPKSTVDEIRRDFRAYEANPNESAQYQMYCFDAEGQAPQDEVSVVLDFGEVVDLRVLR